MDRLDFIAQKAGTRKWVVAARMTPRLKAKGYERAIHPHTYRKWGAEYEAPQARLLAAAAPDLLAALRQIADPATTGNIRYIARAAIAKAEGRTA